MSGGNTGHQSWQQELKAGNVAKTKKYRSRKSFFFLKPTTISSRFILIPCCYFQLDGSRHKGLSGLGGGKYREYTDYVKNIAIQCGYSIDEDQLRIPSTRNIAIVGQSRNPAVVMEGLITETVGHFVARVSDRELEEQRRKKAAEKRK